MNPKPQLGPDCPANERGTDYARWMVWIQVVIFVHFVAGPFLPHPIGLWLFPFGRWQIICELVSAVLLPCIVIVVALAEKKRSRRISLLAGTTIVFVATLFLVLFVLLCFSLAYV